MEIPEAYGGVIKMTLLLKTFVIISFLIVWVLIARWCYREEFHAQGSYLASFLVSLVYTLGIYSTLLCAVGGVYLVTALI